MADNSDSDGVWMYNPSLPLAIIGTMLYGVVFFWIFYLTVIKYRAWFFTCVVLGAAIEVAGYALRSYSAKNQTVLIPFVLTLTFIVLAPVFVAAGNYLLIGRLIRAVLPPKQHRVLGIHGRMLTRIFVTCDVVSFLVQSAGSGVASVNSWTGPMERIGTYILIGGLSFQVLAFSVYMCVLRRFHVLANRMAMDDAPVGWRKVVTAVYVSSALILIRSIYRVAEFAEGFMGYAFRHEWLFWIFEALPMLIAIGIFCIYYPSKYIGKDAGKNSARGSDIRLSNQPYV